MLTKRPKRYALICSAVLLCIASHAATRTARAAEDPSPSRYGRPGDPIHLTVGYQPHYTEAWSGVLVRAGRLYAKHLPAGSSVQFKVGTKGLVLVSALRRGDHAISYLGVAPMLTAVHDPAEVDLRAVAVAGVSTDLCNLVLARKDAPSFGNPRDALAWLDGKRLAVPFGTCADVFVSSVLERQRVQPLRLMDQSIDLLPTGLRAGGLDAVAVWEPSATQLIRAGLAKRLVSGTDLGQASAAFVVMRADFIQARPDVVRGWLRAEREAQDMLAAPRHGETVIRLIATHSSDLSAEDVREALYETESRTSRARYPFVFTPAVIRILRETSAYMKRAGLIATAELRAGAIERAFADEIVKRRR